MRKIVIILLSVIGLLFAGIYIYLSYNYAKKSRLLKEGESYGYWDFESSVERFYRRSGEFPEALKVDFYRDNEDYYYFDSLFVLNLAHMPKMMPDILSRKEGVLVYYPIYNRHNGLRESFVLLSAGIDGKLDNNVTDTLYMDSWWQQLRIYNLEQVMADTFYKQAENILSVRTRRSGQTINGEINYNPDRDIKLLPCFSLFSYLFGKKDYVVRYGLPYYIYRPVIDSDQRIENFDIKWRLEPEIIIKENTDQK